MGFESVLFCLLGVAPPPDNAWKNVKSIVKLPDCVSACVGVVGRGQLVCGEQNKGSPGKEHEHGKSLHWCVVAQ